MEELKRIGRGLWKAVGNFLANLANPRGWGFLVEALFGLWLLFGMQLVPDFPSPNIALVLMLGVIGLSSILETGITPNYREGEEWYKFWYTIKGALATLGLVWIDLVWIVLGEMLPAGKIIVLSVVVFDIAFAAIYGKRLAAYAWRPRVPSVRRPGIFRREVGEESTPE